MTRALSASFADALQAGHVNVFPLVEIGFASGTAYLAGLDHSVAYGGNTYAAALGLLGIDPMDETEASVQGLRISIAGALSSNIATALTERVQGRPITVRLAVIDAAGALQVDANVWSGAMDTMQIEDSPDGATVVIQAEHALALWDKPRPLRYTDAAQQALYPGDKCCEFVASLAEAQIVWPGKAFFKA